MKKYLCILIILSPLVFSLAVTGCKKKETKDEFSDVKGNYFSINQFIIDQWNNFDDMPFVIIKSTRVDGVTTDSVITNSDTLNWAQIFNTFSATDISDRKNLGLYNFNQFDDNQDNTHNFFYMAKDDELFTQKLLITLDQRTLRVKGIYIETMKKTVFDECTQKLYYSPIQKVQIQTDDKPLFGKRKHTVVEWDFQR